MKNKIFNTYVKEVCRLFGISNDMLFTKIKRRDVVDARQLLFYLCRERQMSVRYIQEYMMDNGFSIHHSTIGYGINKVEKRMVNDKDWLENVQEIINAD